MTSSGGAELSDHDAAELSARTARGDAAALATLYEWWFDRAFRLARVLTARDESFCLDVVQETTLRAARAIKPMASRAELERWLARVVHTAALDLLRAERRRRARETAAPGSSRTPPAPDRVEWVEAKLAELPPEDVTLIVLRFWRGLTLEQAGAALGSTGDAAHGRVRRILSRLRHGGHDAR